MITNQQIWNKLNKIEHMLNQMEKKMNHDFHHIQHKIHKLETEITSLSVNTDLLKRIDAYTTYTACLASYNSAVEYDPNNNTGTLYSCAALLANSVDYIANIDTNTSIVDYDSNTVIAPVGFENLNLAMLTTLNYNTKTNQDYIAHRPADLTKLVTSTNVGGQERSDYFINNILTNINTNLPIRYLQ